MAWTQVPTPGPQVPWPGPRSRGLDPGPVAWTQVPWLKELETFRIHEATLHSISISQMLPKKIEMKVFITGFVQTVYPISLDPICIVP